MRVRDVLRQSRFWADVGEGNQFMQSKIDILNPKTGIQDIYCTIMRFSRHQ